MSTRIEHIASALTPYRTALLEHPIYAEIDRIEALRTFMEHHVFAVWDFMSLLKSLQRRFCCVDVPWTSPEDSAACRMINEIVLAEESDEDGAGGCASHFQLDRNAMAQAGASTGALERFEAALQRGHSIGAALEAANVPLPARGFVRHTFTTIETGDSVAILAAFTFGREDLLPDVFQRIVEKLDAQTGGSLARFRYYLERHIGLDGDEHGPMALRLLASLCGDDAENWQRVESTARSALEARKALWDGIHHAILENRTSGSRGQTPAGV